MKFDKYIYTIIIFGLLAGIGYAADTGGLGIAILPKISNVSLGSQQQFTIKIVSSQNFNDTINVNLTTDGINSSSKADLSWFDWLGKTVNISAGETIQLKNNASIPIGINIGKKYFKVVVNSSRNKTVSDIATINIIPLELPPDPVTVASPIDPTIATNIYSATAFLYTGNNPIQRGVINSTIEAKRTAVLRGHVTTRDGTNISGVKITILSHPEFGSTLTRADGMFDMVVNGGGLLTVNYEKAGYFTVQRQVNAPWQDFVILPDVVMIQADSNVTTINLSSNAPIQVARGSIVNDSDGTRQATLFFQQGTLANMTLPDGTVQNLNTMHVRATEYTVGTNGDKAMPADLPPAGAYGYTVEFSADEAIASRAKDVNFNQPVYAYVDNFLNISVGTTIPLSYYNRNLGQWIPSANSLVIKILSVANGIADLDVDGSGKPANASQLSTLNITDAERQQLASIYRQDQTLLRAPINRFAPWYVVDAFCLNTNPCPGGGGGGGDGMFGFYQFLYWAGIDPDPRYNPEGYNPNTQGPRYDLPPWQAPPGWEPTGPGWGPEYPSGGGSGGNDEEMADSDGDSPNYECGSIIGCQNQELGESVNIVGTPLTLNYKSTRVPGNSADYSLKIQLGTNIPTNSKRIDLEIFVAGRAFKQSFPAVPNQSYTFIWDGNDVYGRKMVGKSPVTVNIGYVHGKFYKMFDTTGVWVNHDIAIWRKLQDYIGSSMGAMDQNIGGWSLDSRHAYDPNSKIIYLGDGGKRIVGANIRTINTIAGNGFPDYSGDGGSATNASLTTPNGVKVGQDGSIYIADTFNNRIRKIGTNGIITTVAGNGIDGYGGDGGPAINASLFQPTDIAIGQEGSIYIADSANHRIRKVGTNGIITTVAGNGMPSFSGDEGPAINASIQPNGVAVGQDGSIYIADIGNSRIRKVGTDGIINTVAGNGIAGYNGDEGPATKASIQPNGVAVGQDGSIYIADVGMEISSNRIRKVGHDGNIITVAGKSISGYDGDGGPAINASLSQPTGIIVGRDDSIYIADTHNNRIRKVDHNGIITTIAGNGTEGYSGDGGLAPQAGLNSPQGVTIGPDDNIYIADSNNNRIRRVSPILPGFSAADFIVSSAEGSEIYDFNSMGKHMRTFDAFSGAVKYNFTYDSKGRLNTITDVNGNVLTIERDITGNATAITSPYGQRTNLSLDTNGFLASITDPAGKSTLFSYTADGLLTDMTDQRGNVYNFSYDSMGRLIRDENPAGGFKILNRTDISNGLYPAYFVNISTGLNRSTNYYVEQLSTGGEKLTNTFYDDLHTEKMMETNGYKAVAYPDGVFTDLLSGSDPRFGMEAPVANNETIKTPSGLTMMITNKRNITLDNPDNPLSWQTISTTTTINDRSYTTLFTKTINSLSRAFNQIESSQNEPPAGPTSTTLTTPEGRTTTTIYDAKGNIIQNSIPRMYPINYDYDDNGRISNITQGERKFSFSYDNKGNLKTLTDPLSRTISYGYDSNGRKTDMTSPDGNKTLWKYDASGNIIGFTPPGKPSHTFGYTPVNLVDRYTPPDIGIGDLSTRYEYDKDKNLINVTHPGQPSVKFYYDKFGRLLQTYSGEIGIPGSYKPLTYLSYYFGTRKLKSIDTRENISIGYVYDGNLVTDVYVNNETFPIRTHYKYDNNFRVIEEATSPIATNAINFQYDNDGLLKQAGSLILSRDPLNGLLTGSTIGNVHDILSYNGYGGVTAYQTSYGDKNIFVEHLNYDNVGRIIKKVEAINGINHVYNYTYDLEGRLTNVSKDGIQVSQYVYDTNGNRFFSEPYGIVYNDQDQLLSLGGVEYKYTPNGELNKTSDEHSGDQLASYIYDEFGNLKEANIGNRPEESLHIVYDIDGLNRRVGKTVNGNPLAPGSESFIYRDLNIIAEIRPGLEVSRFVYGSRSNVPDYMINEGGTYRIISDHLGSPRLVVNTNTGEIVQQMDYDEFGNVIQDTNPGFQPFGFAGGLYDRDTKLVHFGAREYDPETGRWTTKDPILFDGGSTNLYEYVGNDPINNIDYRGLDFEFWWAIGRGSSAVLGWRIGGPGGAFLGGFLGGYIPTISDYFYKYLIWMRDPNPIQYGTYKYLLPDIYVSRNKDIPFLKQRCP